MKSLLRARPTPSVYRLTPLLSFGPISRAGKTPADALIHVGDEPAPKTSTGVARVVSRFEDGDLPPDDQLSYLVGLVVRNVHRGQSVHVTCDEGRNRSVLVAGLALHLLEGVGGEDLVQRLTGARLSILSNREFLACLESLPSRTDSDQTSSM